MKVKFKINFGLEAASVNVFIFLSFFFLLLVKLLLNFKWDIPVIFWLLLPQGQDIESKSMLWT